MKPTFNQFSQILRNIIIRFPIIEGRINTFAYLKENADIRNSTFGCNYTDYLQGYYFDREWHKSGASRDNISGTNSALIIESKKSDIDKNLSDFKSVRRDIYLSALLPAGQNQDGLLSSRQGLAQLNERNIRLVLKELINVSYCSVTENGETRFAWLSPNEIGYLNNQTNTTAEDMGSRLTFNLLGAIDELDWKYTDIASSGCTLVIDLCEDLIELDSNIVALQKDFIVVC